MPGKPAARNMDKHVCPQPLSSGTGVHGPGTITATGAAQVYINQQMAAVEGDMCICVEPGNTIKQGSSTVFFKSKAAARQLDPTTHNPGGFIMLGSLNVFIGD
ncbi:PAAR domain-containing protein [Chryseolinea soli]|uniref:Type VI secretion protein n=1 Tax=Chryseolinea soli TaxID=2321403 RepID=A0A385SSX6_9BACT|nr:PAAR domain-containing protein [Chryseolinea soli]AYB33994.1 type VI secretion protein [Chryseolinea soli]